MFTSNITEREGELVTHPQQLAEADDLVLRPDVQLLHLLNGEPHRVLVMAGHHDAQLLHNWKHSVILLKTIPRTNLGLFQLLQLLDPPHALKETPVMLSDMERAARSRAEDLLVVHLSGGIEIFIDRIRIVECFSSFSFLNICIVSK